MQFKHPELLYALFLLLIPIIVHLFQLRKFKKEAFTNVAFLKEIKQNARKSSQIKKWLILCTRLLLLAAIVIAFAQPFTTKNNTFNTTKETVVYIDNSFSMQAKGNQGELLKRALQDVVSNLPENENVSILTNNNILKNTTLKAIKNDVLQIDYTANKLTLPSVLLKSKTLFSNQKNTQKNLVLISDFQQNTTNFTPETDTLTNIHLVQLKPVNTNNIAIDSAFIASQNLANTQLTVVIKNSGKPVKNLPVSVFNNTQLIAKTSVDVNQEATTTFSLPNTETINGNITINDANLRFDNSLFFNINNNYKINVLAINDENDDYLKRIFQKDEFNLTSVAANALSYNIIDTQNLIILNELKNIPNALISALNHFTTQGGYVLVIPSKTSNLQTYNAFLSNRNITFNTLNTSQKSVTTINYAHPIYNNGVFEKKVTNFQYPRVQSFFETTSNNAASILSFEDGKPLLLQNKNTFIFTAALNTKNSNFKSWNVIVPTFYNIAKQSFKAPKLYYSIGKNNSFEIETQLQQDDILTLENKNINLIPRQKYFNNKVEINTQETPNIAGIYAVKNKNTTVGNVSYNYDNTESNLRYQNLENIKNATVSNSITNVFNTLKSNAKVNALWKWFVIFALVLLIIEMLILKYFK